MDTQARLIDARQALHDLRTGNKPVRVQDQNGESVLYNIANADKLAAYVAQLEAEFTGRRGFATIRFTTSKGV